jgi:hypothetical protein
MAKKRRSGASLPRVTLIAYNWRDLLAFVEAVVEDLRAEENLRHLIAAMKGKRTPKAFVLPPIPEGVLQ